MKNSQDFQLQLHFLCIKLTKNGNSIGVSSFTIIVKLLMIYTILYRVIK